MYFCVEMGHVLVLGHTHTSFSQYPYGNLSFISSFFSVLLMLFTASAMGPENNVLNVIHYFFAFFVSIVSTHFHLALSFTDEMTIWLKYVCVARFNVYSMFISPLLTLISCYLILNLICVTALTCDAHFQIKIETCRTLRRTPW